MLPLPFIVTGRSKGYAFIEYKHKEDADYAWEVRMAGRTVHVVD